MSSGAIADIGYAAIAAAMLLCQVIGLLGPRDWPTVGKLIDFFTRAGVGRIAVMIVWLWLGWHVFVRR